MLVKMQNAHHNETTQKATPTHTTLVFDALQMQLNHGRGIQPENLLKTMHKELLMINPLPLIRQQHFVPLTRGKS